VQSISWKYSLPTIGQQLFIAKKDAEGAASSETELVKEAIGDIDASVAHLFANQPQFGLSKWSSLQATEKSSRLS
jgi:hypothetical protein